MVKLGKISGSNLLSLFYFIAGIALFATMAQSSSFPLHVPLLGILSLINSYGLSKTKKYSIYLTALISLSGITFGCTTAYAVYQTTGLGATAAIIFVAMILYVAALAITFLYVALRRDKLA